jgi:hypothetical protein
MSVPFAIARSSRPDRHLLQLPVKGIQIGEVLLLGLWDCVTHGWGILGFVELIRRRRIVIGITIRRLWAWAVPPGKLFLICLADGQWAIFSASRHLHFQTPSTDP